MEVRILGMTEAEIIHDLRYFEADGVPASGLHRPKMEVLHFLIGEPDWRYVLKDEAVEKVRRLFNVG